MDKMLPILEVDIKTGTIAWDCLGDALGHVYDHACYDADLLRTKRPSEVLNMPIRGTNKLVVIDFDRDIFCESCFCNHSREVELKVKGQVVYCPSCGVRRPLR